MKRWLILTALVIAISATATVAVQYLPTVRSSTDTVAFPVPSKSSGPVPKVVIDGNPKYEFGTKPQQDHFSKEWVIWNKGDGDLVLTKKSTTCSCTAANFAQEGSSITVKPNESTPIQLTFNTKEFSGEYSQRATISTNDPYHLLIELGAHGEVHPALVLTPPERTIPFVTISNDTEHQARIAMSSPDRPDFKVLKASSSKPGKIEVTTVPLTDEERKYLKVKQGGYRIEVTVKPDMALGPFRDEVVIETDHPKQRELRLLVIGKVVGAITLVPEHLRLTHVSAKDGGKGTVTLMVRGLRETKFEVARKPSNLDVAVEAGETTATDGKYRLTVSVPPGSAPKTIDDVIVLNTDHPKAKVVKVPITLYIQN